VQITYNKLERIQQMLKVSAELPATRSESSRVLQQELTHGAALSSQADMAVAQELDAKTLAHRATQAHHVSQVKGAVSPFGGC